MRCVLDSVAHSKITIGRRIRTVRAANVVVNIVLGKRDCGCVVRFPDTLQHRSRNREPTLHICSHTEELKREPLKRAAVRII